MHRRLEMSAKGLNRLEVMQRRSKKQISQKAAGTILDLIVRQLMIADDPWKACKAKKETVHQLRQRRACFGVHYSVLWLLGRIR